MNVVTKPITRSTLMSIVSLMSGIHGTLTYGTVQCLPVRLAAMHAGTNVQEHPIINFMVRGGAMLVMQESTRRRQAPESQQLASTAPLARFLRQVPVPVNLARLASTIYRLDKQSVSVVKQASFQQVQEQHKVQYVITVKQASFQKLQEQQYVQNVKQARPQRQVPVSVHLVMTFLCGMKSINVCLNICKHVFQCVLVRVWVTNGHLVFRLYAGRTKVCG
jgi:hypothetical protein